MNSALTMPLISWSLRDRSRRNASNSSTKIIDGCNLRASEKSAETSLFDSPYLQDQPRSRSPPTRHLSCSTLAFMLMNVAPDSFASALASIVLPQPGGP